MGYFIEPLTDKQMDAAERLLNAWQGEHDSYFKPDYYRAAVEGLVDFLDVCRCKASQEGGVWRVEYDVD